MKILFGALLCVFALLGPAQAADDLPKDFFAMESTGLLQSQAEGSFGNEIWDGSTRADIAHLIRLMPVSSESPVVQRLIRGVLLGSSDTSDLEGAKDVQLGEDFLTLRLSKLLQAGLYQQALDLFTAAGETEHHPATAKAGILAMLGSGQKSLACVEGKIFENAGVDADFWTDLRAYCDYTLSDPPSDKAEAALKGSPHDVLRSVAFNADYRFAYKADNFAALSKLEQTILIAEQRIEAVALSAKDINALPPYHLSALLAMESIQRDAKLRLNIRAAALGFISYADLEKAYKMFEGAPLPDLFVRLTKAEDVQALALEALGFEKEYGVAALVPFAPFFENISAQNLSLDTVQTLQKVFYRNQSSIPKPFLESFLENVENFDVNSDYFRVAAAFSLHASGAQRQELSKIIQKNIPAENNPDFFAINVIENLDKGSSDVDNALKAYEKDFILTSKTQHAMPSRQLWNRLNTISQDKILGETALLSVFVLSEGAVKDLYPGLLSDVLRSFRTVGLTNVSNDLAFESLIGN